MVENLVKYVENNYFLPRIEFTTFDTLNKELNEKSHQRLSKGKYEGESWEKRFLEESFMPFKEEYRYARIKEAKVDTYQLIHLEKNRYSVPTRYIGKKVEVHIYPFTIKIIYKTKVIAQHERLFGNNKESLNPYHYLCLIKKKARAYEQAKVIQQWGLPQIYEKYHKMLQNHLKSESKGTREFIDILKLTEEYKIEVIARILKELDEKNRYSYQDVLSTLRYQMQAERNTKTVSVEKLKSLNVDKLTTTHLSLETYNELLNGVRR